MVDHHQKAYKPHTPPESQPRIGLTAASQPHQVLMAVARSKTPSATQGHWKNCSRMLRCIRALYG